MATHFRAFVKGKRLLLIAAIGAASITISGIAATSTCDLECSARTCMAMFSGLMPDRSPSSGKLEPRYRSVSALGRLEPKGEIVRVMPPAFLKDERVAEIKVVAGQTVHKGDIILVMDNRKRLLAELNEANRQVSICRAQLRRVLAGAAKGEIGTQEAFICRSRKEREGQLLQLVSVIDRLKAEQSFAETQLQRFEKLHSAGAVSTLEVEARRTNFSKATAELCEAEAQQHRVQETGSAAIAEAVANLEKVKEVRSVDVEVAQAELENAMAAAKRIVVDLELACVRAPQTGRVLKVWAHAGEGIGSQGIVELGETTSMVAVAEVYESDVRFIRLGHRVLVTSPAFEGVIYGTVTAVGCKVNKQSVYSSDPGDNFDERVVEVKASLSPASSAIVAGFTNLQVRIVIQAER